MKTSEEWVSQDQNNEIVDCDGWDRHSSALAVFWHCVPISEQEYHNRRNKSSTISREDTSSHEIGFQWSEADWRIWNEFKRTKFGQLLISEGKIHRPPSYLSTPHKRVHVTLSKQCVINCDHNLDPTTKKRKV